MAGGFFPQLKISAPKEEFYEAKKRLLETVTSFSEKENFIEISMTGFS
jgi:hypothetical protein